MLPHGRLNAEKREMSAFRPPPLQQKLYQIPAVVLDGHVQTGLAVLRKFNRVTECQASTFDESLLYNLRSQTVFCVSDVV